MLQTSKIPVALVAFLCAVGCAGRKSQQGPVAPEERQKSQTSTSTEQDENLAAGGGDSLYEYDPLAASGDIFPLSDATGVAGVSGAIDPATQGLQSSQTLAQGSINPGNNAAGGGGFNPQMMQGMMGLMSSAMSGQQPNPQALMGMFSSALGSAGGGQGGAVVQQMMPMIMQGMQGLGQQ